MVACQGLEFSKNVSYCTAITCMDERKNTKFLIYLELFIIKYVIGNIVERKEESYLTKQP